MQEVLQSLNLKFVKNFPSLSECALIIRIDFAPLDLDEIRLAMVDASYKNIIPK